MTGQCPVHRGLDPLDSAFVHQPYPALTAARRESPVTYLEPVDLWLVTRYADVEQVLLDPATFSNASAQAPVRAVCPAAQKVLVDGGFSPPTVMSRADPPDHRRVRTTAAKVVSFTPRRTEKFEPWIHARVTELIDAFAQRGHADLVAELTGRLPADVVFRLVGFPAEDTPLLLSWCGDRLQLSWGRPDDEQQVAIAENMVAYWKYLEDFVAERARDPQDDYASDLIALHREDPESISLPEIAAVLYGLTFAGQETTNNLMASMIFHLLSVRERWEELLADRSLVPNAVEEALRYDPSVAGWRRTTTCDTIVGGVAIPKGSTLLLHLGSAGHDEARFTNGDAYDLRRDNARQHLAFGKGIHYCLGAGLARLEAVTVLELLLERLPELRLADGWRPDYVANIAFRGPTSLDVVWPAAVPATR